MRTEVVLEAEASRAQVDRILQNKNLRLSEVQRRLLLYLVDKSLAGEADELKEYTVGVDAFGKPASYDPRQESVVRMHVARLRQKLAEYYRTEGLEDPVLVDLPKGGFKVVFEPRPDPVAPPTSFEPVVLPAAKPAPFWRRSSVILAGCLAVAVACAGFFAVQSSRARSRTAGVAWTPELNQLWSPILSTDRPLVVCIATPLLVRFPGFGLVRDRAVNDWGEVSKSNHITALKDALHVDSVAPAYSYTGVGTASGAFLLGQFLAPRKQNVLLTRTDLLSVPEIAMDNVVVLGPVTGSRQIQAIPANPQIVLEQDGIRVLNPRPGEPALITDHPASDPQGVEESHALISHVPGLMDNGDILYFSGNQISSVMAAVQAFTDPALARTLVSRLKGPNGNLPRYYQVVLKVRSMDDMPVEISYMLHRELPAKPPAKP
ncbi:MAG TPA: hypothetical protein VJ732_16725 [Bryobacteraceae bacterium]|nr:hypothetical protein [Bryobacteraceae bacterium]